MRGRWLTVENKQSEQAIAGSACNPKRVPIGITLGLLLAGITMSLSGCGGGGGDGGGGGGPTPVPSAQVVSGLMTRTTRLLAGLRPRLVRLKEYRPPDTVVEARVASTLPASLIRMS